MGSFWIGKIVLRERSPSKVTPSEASGERAKARGLPNLTLVNNAVEPAETAGAWHSTCSHLDSARGRQETVSTQHAHQIPTLARPNTNFPRSSTAHLSMAQSACRRLPSPSPTTLPQTFALRALAPAPADGLRAVAFVFDDADAATEALAPSGLPGTVPPGFQLWLRLMFLGSGTFRAPVHSLGLLATGFFLTAFGIGPSVPSS